MSIKCKANYALNHGGTALITSLDKDAFFLILKGDTNGL